jgi:hypothetical protein
MHSQPPRIQLCKKAHKPNSRWLAGKIYPHEIGIRETPTNHRKLDSQAALSGAEV